MSRKAGYYWVCRLENTHFEVAEWANNHWWLTGTEYAFKDAEFSDIEEEPLIFTPKEDTSLFNLLPEDSRTVQAIKEKVLAGIEANETMEVSAEDYKELQGLYKYAVQNSETVFVFKGRQVLVTYAKYMLEYLSQFFHGKD